MFAQQHAYTGLGADAFRTPAGVTLRPVSDGEVRLLNTTADGRTVATIVNTQTSTQFDEIPLDGPGDDDWPCFVLKIDQGAIGLAAGSFLEYGLVGGDQMLCHITSDKCHRVIRDCKGMAKNVGGGAFQSMQAKTNHTWKLNYKPFNSGTWQHELRELLQSAVNENTSDSVLFLRWVDKICESMLGKPYDGSESMREEAFNALPRMQSFSTKGPLGKMMRWFSWNNCAEFHLPEFWGIGFVLEHYQVRFVFGEILTDETVFPISRSQFQVAVPLQNCGGASPCMVGCGGVSLCIFGMRWCIALYFGNAVTSGG